MKPRRARFIITAALRQHFFFIPRLSPSRRHRQGATLFQKLISNLNLATLGVECTGQNLFGLVELEILPPSELPPTPASKTTDLK
jgi:hypothetical protein